MIEQLTQTQVDYIKKLDSSLDTVKRLKKVPVKSEIDLKYYNEANNDAFEAYWGVTREIRMKEGEVQILVDKDMVKVCNALLSQKGFKQ